MPKKEKAKSRNIGLDVKAPQNECQDGKCPFHGALPVRGAVMKVRVVSSRASKTVVVEKDYLHFLQKYQRYERRHSRFSAYNPGCIAAKEGDVVTIAECRPLSKTKSFVVVEKGE